MTEKDEVAKKVVAHMLEHDQFSKWLGIELIDIREGYSKIAMPVREEMLNGLGIVHGGIAFSLADSAFAFAFLKCLPDARACVCVCLILYSHS